MSEKAKQTLWTRLEKNGELDFDQTVTDLVNDFEVQRSTAANYVYKYCAWEERDGGKVIFDRADEYKHGSGDSAVTADDGEAESGIVVGDLDEPLPDPTGRDYHGLKIVEEGHPLVPEVREYLERKLDSDTLDYDLGDNIKDVEFVAKALDIDDFGLLLIGEPGTGKGHLVRKVFAETNRPLVRVNFGSRITKEKLVGGFVPRDNGDGLDEMLEKAKSMAEDEEDLAVADTLEILNVREKFTWKDGLLTKAVRNGWGFLGDELNAAPPEALMPLYGLLEDADARTLELTEKGEVIKPHPEFKFVSTMNPPHHAGTQELSDALMRRLIPVTLPYLPKKAEKKILRSRTPLDDNDAESLVDLAQDIRASYPNDIGTTCTPSELEKIGKLSEVMGVEGATRSTLLSMAHTQNDQDALKRRIDLTF